MNGTVDARLQTDSTRRIELRLEGAQCNRCVSSIRDVLKRLPGVKVERIDRDSAVVLLESDGSTEDAVIAAVWEAGYKATMRVQR